MLFFNPESHREHDKGDAEIQHQQIALREIERNVFEFVEPAHYDCNMMTPNTDMTTAIKIM